MAIKRTFSLDEATVATLDLTAERLGIPKSEVVRESIHEYAARVHQLSAGERRRLLRLFDELVPQIPERPARGVDRELARVRESRRSGGRQSPSRGPG